MTDAPVAAGASERIAPVFLLRHIQLQLLQPRAHMAIPPRRMSSRRRKEFLLKLRKARSKNLSFQHHRTTPVLSHLTL